MKRSERIADLYAKSPGKFWGTATFNEAKKVAGCDFETFRKEKIAFWTAAKAPATGKALTAEEAEELRKKLETVNKRAAEMAAKLKAFEESSKK